VPLAPLVLPPLPVYLLMASVCTASVPLAPLVWSPLPVSLLTASVFMASVPLAPLVFSPGWPLLTVHLPAASRSRPPPHGFTLGVTAAVNLGVVAMVAAAIVAEVTAAAARVGAATVVPPPSPVVAVLLTPVVFPLPASLSAVMVVVVEREQGGELCS